MTKRKLLLSGAGLALLLAGGAMSLCGSEDDGQWGNLYSNPMQHGGTIEKTLQIVPPIHDAIWPPLPIFC